MQAYEIIPAPSLSPAERPALTACDGAPCDKPDTGDLRLAPRHLSDPRPVVDCASGKLDWDVFLREDKIGLIRLDFLPPEFDQELSRRCPAVRVCIAPQHRGFGLGAASLNLFISLLQSYGFHRPLLAAFREHDEAAEAMLLNAGFIPTGCRSRDASGAVQRHMVALPTDR